MKKKIKSPKADKNIYYDDCPICQAMKMAEKRGKDLSMEELEEAFRKAKEQGAVLGGSLVSKKDKIN